MRAVRRHLNSTHSVHQCSAHLGMSREEAEQLTMTEFQMLLAAKFPEQKGFTKEEYDTVTDDFLERQARRRAKLGLS